MSAFGPLNHCKADLAAETLSFVTKYLGVSGIKNMRIRNGTGRIWKNLTVLLWPIL